MFNKYVKKRIKGDQIHIVKMKKAHKKDKTIIPIGYNINVSKTPTIKNLKT